MGDNEKARGWNGRNIYMQEIVLKVFVESRNADAIANYYFFLKPLLLAALSQRLAIGDHPGNSRLMMWLLRIGLWQLYQTSYCAVCIG